MPKRITESEKLVRIDLWIKPATKAEIDKEARDRDLTRQAVIRERVERKTNPPTATLARVDQLAERFGVDRAEVHRMLIADGLRVAERREARKNARKVGGEA